MSLHRREVVAVLDEFGAHFSYTQDAEGFNLPRGWMLRSGSGIAGRSGAWFLWHVRASDDQPATGAKSPTVTTIKGLRGIIHEAFCVTCEPARARAAEKGGTGR